MPEIDSFNQTLTAEQQSEYLKSINQSMTRLVDISERTSQNSSSQFFQSNAVQSTLSSFKDVTQGAYSRFEDDLVTTRDRFSSINERYSGFKETVSGTVSNLSEHIPKPLSEMGATGFFGMASPAYATNYRSTFWNDLWAGALGDRAPQTMFQSDFQQIGMENLKLRWHGLSPLRGAASLMGISTGLDNENIDSIVGMSQRYNRSGTSNSITGVGSTRGQVISLIERERGQLLDQLGYNYDDFNAGRQIFAAGGQFIGTKSELERSGMTFQGMGQAEVIAKTLAVPIQEAARAMMDVRSQMGITSLAGQTSFITNTQALGMASGLSYQETMAGAVSGAGIARSTGFSVLPGSLIGRNYLASVNAGYLDGAIGESSIQSAGGVQNLTNNLASSAMSFAQNQGSMYYLAASKGGNFNQVDFNNAASGFTNLGELASGNAGTMQGYANFIANTIKIQEQAGSTNVLAMQRAHLNNIFKSATGRDMDQSNEEDTNMMKMLASQSGMFSDGNTAKAFVDMNFTRNGLESQNQLGKDAYRAERMLKNKAFYDQSFKQHSTDALARDISNIWNKPRQAVRSWFNETFKDIGGYEESEERYRWATGQMNLGETTQEDVKGYVKSRDTFEYGKTQLESLDYKPIAFARVLTGSYEGASLGVKAGTALSGGAIATGLGMMAVGGLMSLTGIGAVPGAALVGYGASTALFGVTSGIGIGLGMVGAGGVAGGIYGGLSTPGTQSIPGFDQLKSPEGMRDYNKTVKAWNYAGGFNDAEKNTMLDPNTQKNVINTLMKKGLGSTTKLDSTNAVAVSNMIRETAKETGMSEEMVASIAKTQGGLSGDLLYGSDLAGLGSSYDPMVSGKVIEGVLKDSFGNTFHDLINDTGFLSKFSGLINAGGDIAERKMAAAKLMGSYSLDPETQKKIGEFVQTGGLSDYGLKGSLNQRLGYLRERKVKEEIGALFGAKAKESGFSEVSGIFEEISGASSAKEQINKVLNNLDDDTFKRAISKDDTLKNLLPLSGSISRGDLSSKESFKDRFKFNIAQDDLKDLMDTFDKQGEQGVKKDLAAEFLARSAKSDTSISKQNEAQMLKEASETFRQAADIIKGIKK